MNFLRTSIFSHIFESISSYPIWSCENTQSTRWVQHYAKLSKLFWVPCLSFEIFSLKNWAVAAIIDKCIAIDEMPRTLEWYCVMIAHTVRKLINNPIKQIETFLSRLSSYKTCFMSRKTTKKSHFIREYSEWALEADERFSLFHSQGSKIKRLKLF